MLSSTATHADLLKRIAGEDGLAWVEFCDRYGELIRSFCRRRGVQVADIDDIQQDVLISLRRTMPGFHYDPSKGRFRAYLKTVVLHAIFRHACQNAKGGVLADINEQTRAASDDTAIDDLWEAEWRQHHLRNAMRIIESEFNERDRQAFQQYAVDGVDAGVVAQTLGLSVDQVYQAKSRILRRLTDLIRAQVEDEG
jgi:RNA polymerase sigma-70 factor (ECF subfamily)